MAGRIPQYFIDDLLTRIDIVDVIDLRVKLKKTGRNYSACCPFHKEKTPSFSVSPDKQFYYCFGCGASGNALGFVMDHDHLDFPEAVETLAGQLGLDVPREENPHQQRGPDHSELYNLMARAVDFYSRQLKQHGHSPKASHYLKSRGLDQQTCQHFAIGFAPPGWDNLKKELATSPEKEQQLITTGMLVNNEDRNTVYDRFRERIIFPIRDSRGRYIAFGGRVLGDEKPKYLNSPESPVFHKGKELYGLFEARQANRKLSRILVVEGYMDVIALAQQGITNAVATLGTATTSDHMQRLFKVVPEVIFCFDGDDAGRRAAWRALESTLANMLDGRQARFLFLPQGEDPDTMVRQEGAEGFIERIKSQAISLDNLLFRELESELDLTTMDGRARLAKLAQPYIDKLPEGLFRQLLLKKLSDRTGLDTHYLEAHFQESARTRELPGSRPEPETRSIVQEEHFHHNHYEPIPFYDTDERQYPPNEHQNHTTETLRKPSPARLANSARLVTSGYAIRQLLCSPEFAREVSEPFDNLKLENDNDSQLLIDLLTILKKEPLLNTSTLIAQWYGTDKGKRLQALAALDHGTTAHRDEFLETLAKIRKKHNEVQNHNEHSSFLSSSLQNKRPSQLDEETRKKYLKLLESKRQSLKYKESDSQLTKD
ncbi:DNA primase [Endozoicomonas sp. SCSIO W0465]|uniref:DNA primase n=1 Tax=Endozoicomonas sp. SCSIO W0465 TaxID=2918516 RepID=UPI002074D1EA|nr:DNA primase [Endozoicomonas sp. SCSIO W0465]USE37417.1 DNA primase [Endozoicomonas sp. SCSIO W0465]